MKISTVIPVYNAEKYLERCIDSVLGQRIEGQEIICVDDGSKDGSIKILNEYEKQYDNVHVLTQNNSYAGSARNFGMSIAKGEYIHFLDADDYVIPGAYLKVYKLAKKKNADFIKARSKSFDIQSGIEQKNNYYSMEEFSEKYFDRIISMEECLNILLNTTPAPWTSFVKRSYIMNNKIKFNSLQCVNDRSFYVNIISHTNRIVFSSNYLVIHQVNNKESLVGIRNKHFMCNIKSYEIVRDVVSDISDHMRKRVLSSELESLVACYAELSDEQKKENSNYLRSFFDKISWQDLNRQVLSSSLMQPIYILLNKQFSDIVQYKIENISELNDYINNSKEIIVYGAGRVCETFIQYVQNCNYNLDKINYIVVSDKLNNPDNIKKIPVYSIKEADLGKSKGIIIATFENVQLSIYHSLALKTSCNIRGITDHLYEELKKLYS